MSPTSDEGTLIDAYLFSRAPPSAAQVPAFLSACSAASLSAASAPRALSATVSVVKLTHPAHPAPPLRALRQTEALASFEAAHSTEVVLLAHGRPRVRLAVFDMDSTLIDQEVIDELARTVGKAQAVAAITERAMRGELDFAASLRERCAMLAGARADVWRAVEPAITFAPGARQLCARLKAEGVAMAVLSGGFQPMADYVKAELALDVAVANHLVTAEPSAQVPYAHLTGELVAGRPIVSAARKHELLLELAAERGIALAEVLCVGDGANDLDMLGAVGDGGGVAVACRAKPKVQAEAPNRLNGGDLADLLYLFGWHGEGE